MSEKSDKGKFPDKSKEFQDQLDSKISFREASQSRKEKPFIDFSGKTFAEFQLIRLIGRGAMADVYLAEQTTLHRKVAIKILRADFITDEAHLIRFKREARASASLTHPNIVQVYSTGESEGHYYIAQEYVRGTNLKEHVHKNGPVSVMMAIHIIKQVAIALQASGNANIIHRDIKPDNIMISSKGDVKVADFGLALLTEPENNVDVTQVGITVGTPRYMSPEQFHGKKLDQRSDIYSLGITAYQMLAGNPPFRGDTPLKVAVQHINNEAKPLSSFRPDILPAICELVHKMIRKDPKERYSNGNEIVEDLKKIMGALKSEDENATELTLTDFPTVEEPTVLSDEPPVTQFLNIVLLKQGIVKYLVLWILLAATTFGISWALRSNPLNVVAREEQGLKSISQLYNDAVASGNDESLWLSLLDKCKKSEDSDYLPKVYEHMTIMYIENGQLSKAQEKCDQWIALASNKVRGNLLLALIANLNGQQEKAKIILNREVAPNRDSLDRDYKIVFNKLTTKLK